MARLNHLLARHWAVMARATAIWLLIIGAESVNGVFRTMLIMPLIGDLAARQLGVLTGSLIILLIALLTCWWLAAWTSRAQLAVGIYWVVLTVGFEIALGRVLGYSWERIASDYNIAEGALLPLGLVVMVLAPLIAVRVRGIQSN